MNHIVLDKNLCKKDGMCVAVCGFQTLRMNAEGFPEEIPGKDCIQCGHCVAICAAEALSHTGLPQEALVPVAKELPSPALIDGLLVSRRSVREFKDRPVSRETLEALLDVARRAPTAKNSQMLHWIVVDNAAKVRGLAEEVLKWGRDTGLGAGAAGFEMWEKGYDCVLRGASAVVVACAPADYGWGIEDCAIALTFFELAAESRGLGVCWAGYLTRAASAHAPIRQALAVPKGYVVCGGLMLGEPKYKYRRVPPRKPLSVNWV